jgi:hypothetical protein
MVPKLIVLCWPASTFCNFSAAAPMLNPAFLPLACDPPAAYFLQLQGYTVAVLSHVSFTDHFFHFRNSGIVQVANGLSD